MMVCVFMFSASTFSCEYWLDIGGCCFPGDPKTHTEIKGE